MSDIRTDMLRINTPVEHHSELGLLVKREDLACFHPGPQFSKTRGVFAHIRKMACSRPELKVFGALDTYHSQAGHAVARACQLLGLDSVTFYPEYVREPGPRLPQKRAQNLGTRLVGIPAGRSAVLYHGAKAKLAKEYGEAGYMMPNALKLQESVDETAREVSGSCLKADVVVIPVSSATIASGVIKGFLERGRKPRFILHMGYSRSKDSVMAYVKKRVGCDTLPPISLVDEGYEYKQKAREGYDPPFPCSPYYDLKAFRWWMTLGKAVTKVEAGDKVLMWNIG